MFAPIRPSPTIPSFMRPPLDAFSPWAAIPMPSRQEELGAAAVFAWRSMCSRRSLHEVSNASAASFWSCSASAPTSTPAAPELREHRFAVAPVGRHLLTNVPVLEEGDEASCRASCRPSVVRSGHGRRRCPAHSVLGARAGPQEALHASSAVRESLPSVRIEELPVRSIDPPPHRQGEPVLQLGRDERVGGSVPSRHEHGRYGADPGIEPCRDTALEPPQVGLGRTAVLLVREQQRHVDRDAGGECTPRWRSVLRPCPGP